MYYWIFNKSKSAILRNVKSTPDFQVLTTQAAVAAPARALDEPVALEKQKLLFENLRAIESVLVALSGGADSAYLAWAADHVLGNRAVAITALSASFSKHDREQVERFISLTAVRHEFIETAEFENPLYVANNADRCYHCKDELFDKLDVLAAARGVPAIAYGINADDTRD